MSTINKYLDDLKKKNDIPSDRQLAIFLGVSSQYINQIRHSPRSLSEEVAFSIASELKIDPAIVFAELRAERAKSPEIKEVWKRIAKIAGNAAAIAAVFLILGMVEIDNKGLAFSGLVASTQFEHSIHYAQFGTLLLSLLMIRFTWSITVNTDKTTTRSCAV
jgi:transcriptional regulator with XRE-family HTH domain